MVEVLLNDYEYDTSQDYLCDGDFDEEFAYRSVDEKEYCKDESLVSKDILRDYFATIRKYPLLSEIETKKYYNLYLAGDESAKNMLIVSNLRLVINIAKKYNKCGVPLEDLIQEGTLGLISGIDKYNPDRGTKLSTCLYWWIRKAIFDAANVTAGMIKIPHHLANKAVLMDKFVVEFEKNNDRKPTDKEIQESLKFSTKTMKALNGYCRPYLSLDEDVTEGKEDSQKFIDLLVDEDEYVERQVLGSSLKKDIYAALAVLNERERSLVCKYYGLNSPRSYTLQECADALGVSRQAVQQQLGRALLKIKRDKKASALLDYIRG